MKRKHLKQQLFNFFTLKFLDNHLEKIFIKILHKRKQKYIDNTLQKFNNSHPDATILQIKELNEKLIAEADRVYDIVDKSLLRAGIKRAKYTFLVTALITIIIMGILIAVTHGGAVLALPLVTPVFTWVISISTIPISYNERVKGGLDAVLHAYEAYLLNNDRNDYLHTESSSFASKIRPLFESTLEPMFDPTTEKNDDTTKILLQTLQTLRNKIDELCGEIKAKSPDRCSNLDSTSSSSSLFNSRKVDSMASNCNQQSLRNSVAHLTR